MPSDAPLRAHLVELLTGRHAHVDLLSVLESMPPTVAGARPDGAPHTLWQLVEHLRIAQSDILEFSRRADHVSPPFPDGYWPVEEAVPSASAWRASVRRIREDLDAMVALVRDPAVDLLAPIPHGDGQTALREALLVADHNAYHLGQIVLLLKQLGAWADNA